MLENITVILTKLGIFMMASIVVLFILIAMLIFAILAVARDIRDEWR